MPSQNNKPAGALDRLLNEGTAGFDAGAAYDLYENGSNTPVKSGGSDTAITAEPANNPPRLTITPGSSSDDLEFTNESTGTWNEPLYFTWSPAFLISNIPQELEWVTFKFSTSGEDLGKGDTLIINRASQTFSGHPGFVSLVNQGGTSNSNIKYRFTLGSGSGDYLSDLSGGGIIIANNQNYTTAGSGYISISDNLRFTNQSGSKWSGIDRVKCEIRDSGDNNWYLFDVATFSSVDVPDLAELRITSLYHDLTY
ncbi:hypothetical protein [Salinibacter ruber]|uniref:Uncharacterized protein n=1 Tax=Salinibacter ruber TaxID=146919 RepID=A0AAW5P7R9_9BACT|nr:hypothetical protein [Salinibacter ruber]MCS4157673.1 hypothetical protein [Salinibacter ruber]